MSDEKTVAATAKCLRAAESKLAELIVRTEEVRTETENLAEQRKTLLGKKEEALRDFGETGNTKDLDQIEAKLGEAERCIDGMAERAAAVETAIVRCKREVFNAEKAYIDAHRAYWHLEENDVLAELRRVATPLIYRAMAAQRAHTSFLGAQRYVQGALPRVFNLSEKDLAEYVKDRGSVRCASVHEILSSSINEPERQEFQRLTAGEAKRPERQRKIREREAQEAAKFAERREREIAAESAPNRRGTHLA